MKQATPETVTETVAELERDLDTVKAVPFLDGVLLEGVTLTSGSWVRLRHKLGRPWVGYFTVAQFNDSGAGYFYARRTANDSLYLELHATDYTANPELSLWVF